MSLFIGFFLLSVVSALTLFALLTSSGYSRCVCYSSYRVPNNLPHGRFMLYDTNSILFPVSLSPFSSSSTILVLLSVAFAISTVYCTSDCATWLVVYRSTIANLRCSLLSLARCLMARESWRSCLRSLIKLLQVLRMPFFLQEAIKEGNVRNEITRLSIRTINHNITEQNK